jgi:hypothetical protein
LRINSSEHKKDGKTYLTIDEARKRSDDRREEKAQRFAQKVLAKQLKLQNA